VLSGAWRKWYLKRWSIAAYSQGQDMELFQIKNIALFIDFENIHNDAFDVERLVEKLKERGRLIIKKAYADWGRFIKSKQSLLFNSVELVELPSSGYRGKNSSDIKLTIDALETALSRPYIDTFVVVSGDSDFTPLISKLRELDKYVIVFSNKEHTSKLLKGYCDELIYLSAVMEGAEEKLSLQSGYALLRRAVESLENLRGEARSSLVKSQIMRLDPSFSEENYGFKQFRRFLEQAESDGIIKLKALGDGENRVKLAHAGRRSHETDGNETPEPPAREKVPAEKSRESRQERARETPTAAAPPAPLAAPPVATADLRELAGMLLFGVDLTKKDNGAADLSDLAHCCKRLNPQLTPDRYGVPRNRGFKGLVQLIQDQGYVVLNYDAAGNRHSVLLTDKGIDLLRELERPAAYEEIRYKSLLNAGEFRARLLNEKQVHDALTRFLEQQSAQGQPSTVREFLIFARNNLITLPAASLPRILRAFQAIGVLTLEPPAEGAWEASLLLRLEPWRAVVERIIARHSEQLQAEFGEGWRKDVYLSILQAENPAEVLEDTDALSTRGSLV
jgi:uncharacterized LabA/DUF88 family protein